MKNDHAHQRFDVSDNFLVQSELPNSIHHECHFCTSTLLSTHKDTQSNITSKVLLTNVASVLS
ncbi:hypothetical protein HOA93_03265 [bacterium]|nr:hypothetical protein [bacterium]